MRRSSLLVAVLAAAVWGLVPAAPAGAGQWFAQFERAG